MDRPRNNDNSGSIPCEAIEILLAEYEARELDQAEMVLVDAHLESCVGCRAELAREKYLRGTLGDLPLESCPPQVTEKIMAAIGDPSSSPGPRSWSPRPGRMVGWAAAAAAVVLLLTSPLVRDRMGTGPGPTALPEFTPAEIQAARLDAERSLMLAARILDRTERSTVKDVFGHKLPESLSRSIKTLMNTSEGGQG